MNKNRINILTPIPFWHPGTKEFLDGMESKGYETSALDIWDFKIYRNNEIINLIPHLFKNNATRIYKKVFRNHIIKKYIKKDQIVDIHWSGHYYGKYIKIIKSHSLKTFATLFGSDLFRTKPENRPEQRKIFETADYVVMGVNMDDVFLEYFPGLESKILHTQYGSYRLELIDQLQKKLTQEEIKSELNISKSKTIVTLGYNAKPEQQHTLFLNMLKQLPKDIKNRLALIVPLTYGRENTEYLQNLKKSIMNTGVEHVLLENRLTDLDLVKTKLASDITINLQTTDALASSVKEAFASLDVVLVGDWLPYKIYKDIGIYFLSCSLDKLQESFLNVLENFSDLKEKCLHNKQKTLEFASWKYLLPQFIDNYNL